MKKEFLRKLIIVIISAGAIFAVYYFHEFIYGANSIFQSDPNRHAVLNRILGYVPGLVTTLVAIFSGYILMQIINGIVFLLFKKVSNKIKTVLTLLRSLVKWIIIIAVIIFALQGFGVDMGTLLAGLGILALVIGLGAQQIVADIIAGFFIVFEEEYKVGDIITIDGWRGTVCDIGIRVTRLVDASGNIKIINNSDIKSIVNLTKELSVAYITIGIDYDTNLERLELILKDNLAKMKKNIPGAVDGPYYKGVTELNSSSVDLMFVITCKETDIYQVKRDFNREIFLLFNENNITIPFPQVTVSDRKEADNNDISEKESKKAKAFVKDQKEKSSYISEDDNNK